MKIIDNRKDFYDYSCPYSDFPVWVRKEKTIALHESNNFLKRQYISHLKNAYREIPKPVGYNKHGYNYKSILLGICGIILPVYIVIDDSKDELKPDYIAYIEYNKFIEKWNKLYSKKYNRKFKINDRWYTAYSCSDRGLIDWKNHYNTDFLRDIFISLKSPIFIIEDNYNFIINPLLKDYGLYRVYNPFLLNQEIERYLSNDLVMCNQKSPDFGDIYKRDTHGFNEWSFKKKKNTKKRKQK